MEESTEVHYRIVKHENQFYKVHLPTEGGSRMWLQWVGPHWGRVDEETENTLNRYYEKDILSNE